MTTDVVIIGAGVSGLACALELQKRGLRPLVIDASDAVGGRIRTDNRDGFLGSSGGSVLDETSAGIG